MKLIIIKNLLTYSLFIITFHKIIIIYLLKYLYL